MSAVARRFPQTIAAEINSLKEHTKSVVLMASVEIGKRLIEAKEMLPHGEWGDWLKNNVDYSTSTANNLMQIYNEYGDDPQAIGNLSYTKAVALIGIEKEERQKFVEDHDVESMSSRELQKAIKEKKELEKEVNKHKEEVEAQRKAAASEREELERKVSELNDLLVEAESPSSDATDEELERLRSDFKEKVDELKKSQEEIKRLESDLKAKPLEAATVEIVPAEVEKELNDLREKLSEQLDPAELKFKVHFDVLVKEFQNVLKSLDDIYEVSTKEKYSGAISKLIMKMDESLPKSEVLAEEQFEKNKVTIFDALDEGT